MYKISLIVLCTAIAVASCKKKNSTVISNIPEQQEAVHDTTYHVNGLTDIHVKTMGRELANITVIKTATTDKKVTVSIEDLPENIESKLTYASGYPNFSTRVELLMKFVPRGEYPIRIKTVAEGNQPKTYNINLVVDTFLTSTCQATFRNFFSTRGYLATNNIGEAVPGVMPPDVYTDLQSKNTALFLSRIPLYQNKASIGDSIYISSYGIVSNDDPQHQHAKFDFDCETGNIYIDNQLVEGRIYPFSFNDIDTFVISGSGYVDLEKETYTFKYTSKSKNDTSKNQIEYTLTGDFPLF